MISEVKTGVCQNAVNALEAALKKAKSGEIHNVAIVADNINGKYYTAYGYDDIGVILGRIQMAMLDIYKGRME